MKRRVVVTGMGTVSPVGHNVPDSWEAIVAGRSGIAPISRFDASEYRSQIAAEIKNWDPKEHFHPREVRRMDPFVQYAIVATREALADAKLEPHDSCRER
ncbi:MAG: beta-ketoacyl-[acyl-carrier-protein] synthase II, partial [Chloroflexi bacterium]|nr:beta-ketoacyl-[acyl-carrier-protein] synthase II [Chloroflexota bacterium]